MSTRGTIVALLGVLCVLALGALSVELSFSATEHHVIGIALAVLSLITAGTTFFVITHRVLLPLAEVCDLVRKLAAGNLRGRIDMKRMSGDEVGKLAGLLNKLTSVMEEEALHCRDFIRSIPDPVFEIDGKGFITYINEAASASTGYTQAEAVNMAFSDLIRQEDRYLFNEAVQTLLKGMDVKGMELPLVLKDGRFNFFEFTCAPVWREGSVVAMRCTGRDVEERRKIMEELMAAKKEAEETAATLKKTVRDLEEFALLAVRREFKMQEIRERLVKLREDNNLTKGGTS